MKKSVLVIATIPERYNNLQTREHIEYNHTEPRVDHFQHPMQRETEHSVFLYQSMCKVTWTTRAIEFFNSPNEQVKIIDHSKVEVMA